jgi:hypothetical protein
VGCVASPNLNRLAGATLLRLAEVSSPTLPDFRCSAWLEKKVVFRSPKVTMTDSYIMSNIFGFDLIFFFFYDLYLHVGLPDNSFWRVGTNSLCYACKNLLGVGTLFNLLFRVGTDSICLMLCLICGRHCE